MCGISAIVGSHWEERQLEAMVAIQRHRGPDGTGTYVNPGRKVGLGHNRLSIIDLSPAGSQPMVNPSGDCWIIFNGEVYNYLELRSELSHYPFRSRTDTEVVLAAYELWGEACLERFLGMFAFIIWDEREQRLFAARDRFGVKPLYYSRTSLDGLILASEIKALHAAGIPAIADEVAWSTYLATGLYEHSTRTFWKDIYSLPAGHMLTWQNDRVDIHPWYDLSMHVQEVDRRPVQSVQEEYLSLVEESVGLRFRSDVPVGINLSGGLDSSILLGLVGAVQGVDSEVKAFTFVTGDPNYDELPWVEQMLAQTRHPSVICRLNYQDVPDLAHSVQYHQDEPYSGLPTLAYARLFERAHQDGVTVLLDGNGMDEQWAGYDYYEGLLAGTQAGLVQGTKEKPVRVECLVPEFRAFAEGLHPVQPTADALRNLQLRDICYTKIPRAMRFNDRISMRVSVELREPFLDHRLFELALRQPTERKIADGKRKWLLRQIASRLLPGGVVEAPKRPVQTPQREWLRGPLREWADAQIEVGLGLVAGSWLDGQAVRKTWQAYCAGASDNSFYVWQWISLGLMADRLRTSLNSFEKLPSRSGFFANTG